MNQATLIVGGVLAGFIVWLAANGRLGVYVGILTGAGAASSGSAAGGAAGAAGAAGAVAGDVGAIVGGMNNAANGIGGILGSGGDTGLIDVGTF